MNPGVTLGLLDIEGRYFCRTLEDEDRKLEINPTGKVYGETCIPRGKYLVVLDFSMRFKRVMPHLLGVPYFDGIRIHNGSYPKDTHGCILVGDTRIPGGLGGSKRTFERLMGVLVPVSKRKEEIWLEVK